MVTYQSRFLTRAEVWFDHEPNQACSADWVLYHQRSQPIRGALTRDYYTFGIDLSQSQEQLWLRLSKNTAYKIHCARERDGTICECCNPRDPTVMNQFEQVYNTFAAVKGLSPLPRARMEGMAAAGVLDLSVARDPEGHALVYHANYCDRSRATGLEMPSLYRLLADSAARNRIGRANRYLFWSDIMRYKARGLRGFDFGGWYQGTDAALLRTNDFKRGFGGEVWRAFECEQIRTWKGWIVLTFANLLERARLLPTRPKPSTRRERSLN